MDTHQTAFGEQRKNPFGRLRAAAIVAAILAIGAVVVGYLLYVSLLGPTSTVSVDQQTVRLLLGINLVIVVGLAVLVAWRLFRVWQARRADVAGARLHGRLVFMFSAIVVIPAVVIAGFSTVTLSRGIESWFDKNTEQILTAATNVSRDYVRNKYRTPLASSISAITEHLNSVEILFKEQSPEFRDLLSTHSAIHSLDALYVIDKDLQIVVKTQRGIAVTNDSDVSNEQPEARAYVFPESFIPSETFQVPAPSAPGEAPQNPFTGVSQVQPVIWDNSQEPDGTREEFRALQKLSYEGDYYLYAVMLADAGTFAPLKDTRRAVAGYNRAKNNQATIQLAFALSYSALSLLVLLGAIWLGLWAANRLVSPIGRLVTAVGRASEGDLSVRVDVGADDDEIGTLSRAFNQMTGQLESQRNELIDANQQAESRRLFTEAVLSGVTAGVIGVDHNGRITLANRSALELLGIQNDAIVGHPLIEVVPEMSELMDNALNGNVRRSRGQIIIQHEGAPTHLTVRVTSETSGDTNHGFVVTFDDITELVSAQRMSAWADVARRIAHEIKNPLTPIQLSAERLRRKYLKEVESDPKVFEQCTQTIIRQVGDIGRMVDEFSSFARMPAPTMDRQNLSELARQAVFLQRVASPENEIIFDGPDDDVFFRCDGRQVSQAFTNLLKNAAESIEARESSDEETELIKGRISMRLSKTDDEISIQITDNGRGLPQEDRHRLTEPYITTRTKGTGLGLAIVQKIMEDHGGNLQLKDAPYTDEASGVSGVGASIILTFSVEAPELETTPPTDLEQEVHHGV